MLLAWVVAGERGLSDDQAKMLCSGYRNVHTSSPELSELRARELIRVITDADGGAGSSALGSQGSTASFSLVTEEGIAMVASWEGPGSMKLSQVRWTAVLARLTARCGTGPERNDSI